MTTLIADSTHAFVPAEVIDEDVIIAVQLLHYAEELDDIDIASCGLSFAQSSNIAIMRAQQHANEGLLSSNTPLGIAFSHVSAVVDAIQESHKTDPQFVRDNLRHALTTLTSFLAHRTLQQPQ